MEFTAQGIFDKVAGHLAVQGERAVALNLAGEFTCRYRGDNGTMCAVGCLIPDEYYSVTLEGSGILYLIGNVTGNAAIDALAPWEYLLSDLQMVHDDTYNWESASLMKDALRHVATVHDLDKSFLEALSFHKLPGGPVI